MNRVKTGIKGFDELVEGGIPEGFNVLLNGQPGTGKTIFGLQYIYYGAKNGEKGIYVAFDSTVDLLKEQAKRFGWDLDELEKSAQIFFLRVPINKIKFDLFESIDKVKKQMGAKRVVFDSLAMFSINVDLFTIPLGYSGNVASSVSMNADGHDTSGGFGPSSKDSATNKISYSGNSTKRMVYLIVDELSHLGTTNLIITSEANLQHSGLTIDGVSEYACDGIVALYNEPIGIKRMRTMSILKMRSTDHSQYIHNVELGKEGIVVKPAEEVYK
jgi:KaiC/GvpD/RAD55 family RecA-like ATPase